MVNGVANISSFSGNYNHWIIEYQHADVSTALIGQNNYIKITNVQFPSDYQPMNSLGSYDIFMRFLYWDTGNTNVTTGEWLYNVYL